MTRPDLARDLDELDAEGWAALDRLIAAARPPDDTGGDAPPDAAPASSSRPGRRAHSHTRLEATMSDPTPPTRDDPPHCDADAPEWAMPAETPAPRPPTATQTPPPAPSVVVPDPADEWATWRGVGRYAGPPPQREWVIRDTLPTGCAALLAGDGAVGKSLVALDLALTVAGGPASDDRTVLGYGVPARGVAIVVTAEDDDAEIHRRLDAMDPTGTRREAAGDRLWILPLPALPAWAIPTPIGREDRRPDADGRFALGDNFRRLCAVAREHKPALIVLDPLAALSQLPENDNSAGAWLMRELNALARETGALVLATHHVTKTRNGLTAREVIRGAGALVNGARAAVYLAEVAALGDLSARDALMRLADARDDVLTGQRGGLFTAAVAKSNGPSHRGRRLLYRTRTLRLVRVPEDVIAEWAPGGLDALFGTAADGAATSTAPRRRPTTATDTTAPADDLA